MKFNELVTKIKNLFAEKKPVEVLPVVEVTIEKPKRKYVRKNKNATH